MTFIEIIGSMVIGLILTVFLLVLGFKYQKKWLKWVAVIPFVISTFPLLYLFMLFGFH